MKRIDIREALHRLRMSIVLGRMDIKYLEENEWIIDREERMKQTKAMLDALEKVYDEVLELERNGQKTISVVKIVKMYLDYGGSKYMAIL